MRGELSCPMSVIYDKSASKRANTTSRLPPFPGQADVAVCNQILLQRGMPSHVHRWGIHFIAIVIKR